MISPEQIEVFIKAWCDSLPTHLYSIKTELGQSLRLFVQSLFDELNVVTQEEFDAQMAIFHRAKAKLKALEVKMDELEIK